MPPNIYDDPTFFEGYRQLPRSVHGLAEMPEWPALQAMLPPLERSRVLDLGCGFGWFVRWAREQGAAKAVGIDVSERMLAEARSRTRDAAITYVHGDLDQVELESTAYDLVYSSLALHYLERLDLVSQRVNRALVPGGRLVFSVEHPMFTAPKRPGFIVHAAGHDTWPVDAYCDEGPRVTNWLADGVTKQHRTIGTYINLLVEAGFTIRHLEEWSPSAQQLAAHPAWHPGERQRPAFMLVACCR